MGRYNAHGNHGSNVVDGVSGDDSTKIASPSCGGKMVSDHLPNSGGPLQNSLGRELAAEKYGKRSGSDEGGEKIAV